MKKLMSVLLILICGTMACSDSIYDRNNQGYVVTFKERIPDSDIGDTETWKYKYQVADFSNTAGNSPGLKLGSFYLYTSANFSIDDTLAFTTKTFLRSVNSLRKELGIIKDSLQKQIAFSGAEIQKSKHLKEETIKLQTKLNITTTKNQKLTKFKNDLKKLVSVEDSATP